MGKSLIFTKLSRELAAGGLEELEFQPGLNLIVGPPNAGKTVWLQMLDYLMGERGRPEDAFKADLAEKYVAIAADALVDHNPLRIERRWDKVGLKSKFLLNGESLDADGFSDALLAVLEIPNLHFPSGNPYSERSWPRLSWRVLLRHIYRQERFWNDIADKQPESEQHAALVLFLGIAERLFPPEWENLIQKRSELRHLEARKDHFTETVDELARDLIPQEDGMQYLTAMSIIGRIEELERRVEDLLFQREGVLKKAVTDTNKAGDSELTALTSRRAELVAALEQAARHKRLLQRRVEEVSQLLGSVRREVNHLARVVAAGEVLADLKITHCPACDQLVPRGTTNDDTCFLCHQTIHSVSAGERVTYEVDQLEQEMGELEELLRSLQEELAEQEQLETRAQERLELVERELRPARAAISALVGPDISRLDAERGRLEERIRQFRRFVSVLEYSESLESKINELAAEVKRIEIEVDNLRAGISFENASVTIEETMHHFFNLLNDGMRRLEISDSFRWAQQRVSLDLRERSYSFRIGDRKWSSQLGATSIVHFLLGYHYALLNLSNEPHRHYPGLSILDFPPELLDADTIGDKENYLLEPFLKLIAASESPMQVIVAGRAFEGLAGHNRIELGHVWK